MPKFAVLIVVALVLIGALVFVSTLPKEQPTHPIELPVPQGSNAH